MITEPVERAVDDLKCLMYELELSACTHNVYAIEKVANLLITKAGELRRECFLATHRSGEKG